MQGLKSTHCQSKIAKEIQDGRQEIQFFDISKSDGGDFRSLSRSPFFSYIYLADYLLYKLSKIIQLSCFVIVLLLIFCIVNFRVLESIYRYKNTINSLNSLDYCVESRNFADGQIFKYMVEIFYYRSMLTFDKCGAMMYIPFSL